MTRLTMSGTLLEASNDDRVLTYLLAPFGEPGRTNLGKVTLTASSLTIPEDVTALVVNNEHEPTVPVGKFARVEATERGYEADVRFLATRAGDDALTEAREGVRRGISIEVDAPVIRNGQMLAGQLTGAGVCVKPAYPSALMVAADAGDLPEDFPDYLKPTESSSESTEEIVINGVTYVVKSTSEYKTEVEAKGGDTETNQEEPTMTETVTASAPADLTARRQGAGKRKDLTPTDVARMLAAAAATRDPQIMRALEAPEVANAGQLFAALSDVKFDSGTGAPGSAIVQPQWVSALWSRRTYSRRFIPLIPHEDLTSLTIKGWEFDTEPEVSEWSGNKSAVPSSTITASNRDTTARRLAGGHDIAREYRDFNVEGFWEAYFKAMTNSYGKKSDLGTLGDLVDGSTEVVVGTIPSGVPEGLVKVVDGALSFIDDASPSWAVVAPDLWRDILLTPTDKTLEYLNSALGLEEGSLDGFKLVPGPITAGTVLVGAREAATSYELPGSPIRVEALDLVKGGIDEAFFGYYGTLINNGDLLAHVVDTATPPAGS